MEGVGHNHMLREVWDSMNTDLIDNDTDKEWGSKGNKENDSEESRESLSMIHVLLII